MSAAQPRSSAPAWWTVMRREFIVRITDKTFLLSTLTMVVLIAATVALSTIFGKQGSDSLTVGVVDERGVAVVQAAEDAAGNKDGQSIFETVESGEPGSIHQKVKDEELDFGLYTEDDSWHILTRSASENSSALDALNAGVADTVVAANAQEQGVDLAELQAGAVATVTEVADGSDSDVWVSLLPLVFGLVFYLAVVLFGTSIAQSVVAEKESRIVEILAATMSLRSLLLGKILATSLLAFLQIAVFAGTALGGMALMEMDFGGPDVTKAIAWFVPFFVVGFLGLACIWAVAGAVASRTEDLQATSLPLTLGLAVVLFAPLVLDEKWTEILSFVPLFSSVLMPTRMVTGSAELWEAFAALGIGVVFCALTLLVGDRMYRQSVMQTGGRISWFAALRRPAA